MHLIINDMTRSPEIDWINDFIVAIIFIPVEILRLAAMTWIDVSAKSPTLQQSIDGPEKWKNSESFGLASFTNQCIALSMLALVGWLMGLC